MTTGRYLYYAINNIHTTDLQLQTAPSVKTQRQIGWLFYLIHKEK